jgi:uncharacterized phage protein (TIGR01671 family)
MKTPTNRIIKFRAWDKKVNKMYKWVAVMDQHNVYSYNPLVEVITRIPYKVEVMQFTGLLDKNGKEIYENDVVEAEDGVWQVLVENLEDGVVLVNDEKGTVSRGFLDNTYSLEEVEVIGNIYENKELL